MIVIGTLTVHNTLIHACGHVYHTYIIHVYVNTYINMETVFIYYYLDGFIRGRGILATVARLNMLRDLSHLRSSYICQRCLLCMDAKTLRNRVEIGSRVHIASPFSRPLSLPPRDSSPLISRVSMGSAGCACDTSPKPPFPLATVY